MGVGIAPKKRFGVDRSRLSVAFACVTPEVRSVSAVAIQQERAIKSEGLDQEDNGQPVEQTDSHRKSGTP